MGELLITSVCFEEKTAKPTRIRFQNGQLLEGKEAELSCGIYTNDEQAILPTLASEELIYAGKVQREYAYNNFIAIRNKKTNKTRLIAIDHIMLKPQPLQAPSILDSTMMEVNKRAHIELNREFGSKKTKRQTEHMEKLKVNVENFKEELEKTVANISVDEIDLQEVNTTSEYLPPINKDASVAENVYTLKKLIPSVVVKSLVTPVENILTMAQDEIVTTEYVKELILKTQQFPDEQEAKKRITMLLIVDALLNIFSTPVKNIVQRSYTPSQYSKALSDFVLDQFTVKTDKTRTRPLSMKDKASCYILVLTLLMNRNIVNLNDMVTCLKISKKKLQDLSRMLLLTVKESTATVRLPLPAPMSNRKPVKKGRK